MAKDDQENSELANVYEFAKKWDGYPVVPEVPWKESDFCRGVELLGRELIIQNKIDRSLHPVFRDCTLSANGGLERTVMVCSVEQLKKRIEIIRAQNGIPDISLQALEELGNEMFETEWTPDDS